MAGEINQDQKFSRDAALIALAHACDQIAGPDDWRRADKLIDGNLDGPKRIGDVQLKATPVTLSERSVGGAKSVWALLFGLGVLVPIGAIVLGWHFLTRQGDEISVTSSSVQGAGAEGFGGCGSRGQCCNSDETRPSGASIARIVEHRASSNDGVDDA